MDIKFNVDTQVYGAITDLWVSDKDTVVVVLNDLLVVNVVALDTSEQVREQLARRAFEPGIFVCKFKTQLGELTFGDCSTVVLGRADYSEMN